MRIEEDEVNFRYFISRKPKLLKDFDKASKHFTRVFKDCLCDTYSDGIIIEIREEYSNLIPSIPFIANNKFLIIITTECTQYIAMYRVLHKRGMPTEECGRMIVLIAEERIKSAPQVILRLFGWFTHTAMGRRWTKKMYVDFPSKLNSPYAGKAIFVTGTGKEFDFGVDIQECGLRRYFNELEADDIMPYICLIDHIQARAMKVGMHRTETLASGASRCDFRWKKGWEAQNAWPPAWLVNNG